MNLALGRIVALAAGALAGAALGRELDKPADQREWHGEVGGVPYEFRAPTADRVRRVLWDPDNPKLVGPPLFGVGWSVNLHRVAEMISPPPGSPPPGSPPPGNPPLGNPPPKNPPPGNPPPGNPPPGSPPPGNPPPAPDPVTPPPPAA
jgi:hypothetical protein